MDETALSIAATPPSMWLRCVDDNFVNIHEYAVDSLSHHINNIDPHIKFLTIEPYVNGKLSFLDLCVNVMDDEGTKIRIYKKPTHTDQYLNFTSHHPLVNKRYVVCTLTNRAKLYVTTKERHDVLRANSYEEWALNAPPPPIQTTHSGKK